MQIIKKHIRINYSKGVKIIPRYIVIHETDNDNPGADAKSHFNYWDTNIEAKSSVHFVVDDKIVIQLLETNEKAWHVGDNKNYSDITNDNVIGIEICVNSDGVFSKAYENCIELVKSLMNDINIKANRVVRHYDASGKNCPRKIIATGKWEDFKNSLVDNHISMIKSILSIQVLCNKLNVKDYEGKTLYEDNIIGPRTKFAVRKLPTIKKWSKETEAIKFIQKFFDIKVDGIFGDDTERVVKKWQSNIKIQIDGIVGPITWLSFCN